MNNLIEIFAVSDTSSRGPQLLDSNSCLFYVKKDDILTSDSLNDYY